MVDNKLYSNDLKIKTPFCSIKSKYKVIFGGEKLLAQFDVINGPIGMMFRYRKGLTTVKVYFNFLFFFFKFKSMDQIETVSGFCGVGKPANIFETIKISTRTLITENHFLFPLKTKQMP